MKYRRIDANKLIHWGKEVLLKYGMQEKDAQLVAMMLVEADLRKIFSHGMAGGVGIDDVFLKIQNECINLNYQLIIPGERERKYPTIVNIDADGSPGHSTAYHAVQIVKQIANKYGIGKVYVFNANHYGASGIYSELIAAQKNLIGKVYCLSPLWIKPFTTNFTPKEMQKKGLGTNPIAWSTPYDEGIITIDMSTSQRAASVALKAAKSNQELREGQKVECVPEGYLIDSNNQNVLTPSNVKFVRQNCSLLPLGGKQFGYKGFGLSLSIELDHLIGGCIQTDIPAGCKTKEGRVGQIFEAVAIDSLDPVNNVLQKISDDIRRVRDAGGQNMKLPGQIEQEQKKEFLEKGILYSDAQVVRLIKIGETIGIPINF